MSARTIRRAAERKAAKLARKAGLSIPPSAAPVDEPLAAAEQALAVGATFDLSSEPDPQPKPISEARLAANRANATHSSGPVTPAGLAKSSMNALKTGLTGRTVLLPTDDAAAYQQHLDRYFKKFAPTTDEETALVQNIAETEWRLLRIFPLETAVYAVGRIKLADLHANISDPNTREALINGEIQIAYRKDLTNLALQERRLSNQRTAAVAQLEKLQTERRENKEADLKRALALYKSARKQNLPFDPAFFGFVLSIEELEQHLKREQAPALAQGQPSDLTKDEFQALMTQKALRQAA